MTTTHHYTVESLTTGERRTVAALDAWAALDSHPKPCFTVVRRTGGIYSAIHDVDDVFLVAGEHVASTAEAAAASLRQHYAAIQAAG